MNATRKHEVLATRGAGAVLAEPKRSVYCNDDLAQQRPGGDAAAIALCAIGVML